MFEVQCPRPTAERLMIADNASAGMHDRIDVLTGLLAHLRETGNLTGTGYSPEDMDEMVRRHAGAPAWEPLPDTSAMPDELPRPDHIVLELPDPSLRTDLLVQVQSLLAAHPEWKAHVA